MKVYAATQNGIHKNRNEDRVLIGSTILAAGEYSLEMPSGIVAVADGVGGNRAGDTAAQFICNCLAMKPEISEGYFQAINQRLIAIGGEHEIWKGMATTLSGIIFTECGNQIFHVGNTRIYALQAGSYLRQLTEDDTTVNYLVHSGKMTEEEAENYHARSEITACFGGGDQKLLRIKRKNIEGNRTYLMTTDGVHEKLSVDDMEDFFAAGQDYAAVCRNILDAAVQA